jgi:hypothetical protein
MNRLACNQPSLGVVGMMSRPADEDLACVGAFATDNLSAILCCHGAACSHGLPADGFALRLIPAIAQDM